MFCQLAEGKRFPAPHPYKQHRLVELHPSEDRKTCRLKQLTSATCSYQCKQYHCSKSSKASNTFGIKKFNKAHNSDKLFCNGVPVNNSRCRDRNWCARV